MTPTKTAPRDPAAQCGRLPDPEIIAEFDKNNVERIRVALIGHRLCDVRVLADYAGSRGERRPTKRGICLPVDLLSDLIAALQAAKLEASR